MDTHDAPRSVQFTIYQPNLAPMKVSVPAQTITLGRAAECTIPIRDRFLSRKHAEISFMSGKWFVRDCGSVNGTSLNGAKLTAAAVLEPGDRIGIGDSELIFESSDAEPASHIVAIDSDSQAKNLAIPLRDVIEPRDRGRERETVLTSLALQFIEDRPMDELFDFILDRVNSLMHPSRVALALLGADGRTFDNVRLRRNESSDPTDLVISRTLLGEVVEERNVVSFIDTSVDDKLARAESIVGQQIRSAVCAPLLVGDQVLGVLYLDFLARRGAVTHEDVLLIAQIARFAAAKLETTRLREEAIAKAMIDEELRTAYKIQSKLLPVTLPAIAGYTIAGVNRPCKTVSGDYYDVSLLPSGKLYFIIADVSGKGISAALVMSGLATAFEIFTRSEPTPAELLKQMNEVLAPHTAPTKFATVVVGLLDPASGSVEFANAGHVAPLVVSRDGVAQMTKTDMVIGLFPQATYRRQSLALGRGDALVLFTDGVTEAENSLEDQLGMTPVVETLARKHGVEAGELLSLIEAQVEKFCGPCALGDDLTMLAISRAV